MKKFLLLALTVSCMTSGSLIFAQNQSADGKILVAYFSRSGNTRAIAEQIYRKAGGDRASTVIDLFEIKPAAPYPESYQAVLEQGRRELNEGIRPALAAEVSNMASYDIVFIGYPIWFGTTPPPVISFLTAYDFSGKTVIPFSTSGSSPGNTGFQKVKELVPRSAVSEGLHISGSNLGKAQNMVTAWLKKLGY
jgi:flavodoxin